MGKKINKICSFFVYPIIKEFPFFALFLFIFASELTPFVIEMINDFSPLWTRSLLGRIGIILLYDYIFTSLIAHTGSKTLKFFLYAIVLLLYGIDLFLLLNFNYRISLNVLVLLLETNSREASEFMDGYLLSDSSLTAYWKVLLRLLAIICFEFIYNRYVVHRIIEKKKLTHILFFPTILICIWGVISYSAIVRICQHTTTEEFFNQQMVEIIKPQDPISSTILSTYGLFIIEHEMEKAIETTKNLKAIPHVDKLDSLNVILIIGESFNKWHSELYGYNHKTTPGLSRESQNGNLFIFNDAVCPFCLTSPSMKGLLSCNSVSDGEAWSDYPFFPAIFKAAQYNVYFWDNQRTFNNSAPYSISLNSYLYNEDISKLSYTATNDSSFTYDDELVNSFENKVKNLSDHNLIIFHLIGQHYDARERFPHNKKYMHFTTDSIQRKEAYLQDREKRQHIADYDNAILYNDYVIQHILNLFRDKNTVMVFLTDHGEETYDYKDSMYRNYEGMTKGWIKHIHNIPFMVWCSDTYIQNHEKTVESIKNSKERSFMTDNLCQLMFHLGEIKSDYYIPERDVISDSFVPRKRLIEDVMTYEKFDYDEIKNQQ